MMSIQNTLDLLEYGVCDICSDVFNRQYFIVYPDESVYLASVCLIPAIEAYVDGVIVIDDDKPIGVIGSRDVLNAYYNIGKDVFYKQTKDIMYKIDEYLEEDNSLIDVIRYFRDKKIGFAPIVRDDKLIGVISFRDILKIVAKSRIDISIRDIASILITIDPNTSIKDALANMLTLGIRRVVIREDDLYSISGRDILGFLMDNEFEKHRYDDPLDAPINKVNKHKLLRIRFDTSISKAARIIMKQRAPPSLLVEDNYIITPLDIIQKGLKIKQKVL